MTYPKPPIRTPTLPLAERPPATPPTDAAGKSTAASPKRRHAAITDTLNKTRSYEKWAAGIRASWTRP